MFLSRSCCVDNGGDSSPAVVNGVVYIASGNNVHAFGLKHDEEKITTSSKRPVLVNQGGHGNPGLPAMTGETRRGC
jgi:hypothetical protein